MPAVPAMTVPAQTNSVLYSSKTPTTGATVTLPAGVRYCGVVAWGAGGGGGGSASELYQSRQNNGGAGGYAAANLSLNPG